MKRALVFTAIVMVVMAQMAIAGSLSFYHSGEDAVALFTNETGQAVNGLLLTFSAPLETTNMVGIGANMTLESVRDNKLVFAGDVSPFGVWEVDWALADGTLVAAAWLQDGQVVQEIDVHAPTVNITVIGSLIDHPITFSALGSSDPDGKDLTKYTWTWDDGTTAEGYEVTRVFKERGLYKVTLTVVDEDGQSSSRTRVFVVHELPPIVPTPAARWILVYSEDFSSDPGFTSTAPTDVYWDPQQGNYYALIRDVSSGKGYYVGYSPEFAMVNSDFIMQFDFTILTPNWGNYPQVRALNTQIVKAPGDLHFGSGFYEPFYFAYDWADVTPKKFDLSSLTDNPLTRTTYLTDAHPEAGAWYHINVSYHASSESADWTVNRVDDGSLFYAAKDLPFPMSAGFNRFYVGLVTVPPKYGTTSDIRVDNVEIRALMNP